MEETSSKLKVQLDESAVAQMFGSWGSSRSTEANAYGTSKATCIQSTNKSKGSAFSAKSQVDEKNDLKELIGGKRLKIKLPVQKDTDRIPGELCLSPTRKRSKKRKVQTPLPKEKPSLSLEEAAGDKTTEDEEDQYYAYTHTPKRKKIRKKYIDERRPRKSSLSSNHSFEENDRKRPRHIRFSDTSDNGLGSDSDRSRSSSFVGLLGADQLSNDFRGRSGIAALHTTSTTSSSTTQSLNGMTPLLLACRRGSVDHVRRLIKSKEGGDVNQRDDRDFDSLMYAARDGFTEVVRVLISEGGSNANATSKDGFSPLMYASLCGYPETAKVLIEANADVNSTDNTGFTSLMGASQNGHSETVEALLQHGAEPNLVDSNGYSALVHASLHGCFQVVAPLLKYGAAVDCRTKFGSTALMHAAHGAQVEMVKFLLEGGANPKLKDAAGNTPLSLVARSAIVDRAGTTKAQLNSVWKLLQPVSDPLNPNIRRKILRKLLRNSSGNKTKANEKLDTDLSNQKT